MKYHLKREGVGMSGLTTLRKRLTELLIEHPAYDKTHGAEIYQHIIKQTTTELDAQVFTACLTFNRRILAKEETHCYHIFDLAYMCLKQISSRSQR